MAFINYSGYRRYFNWARSLFCRDEHDNICLWLKRSKTTHLSGKSYDKIPLPEEYYQSSEDVAAAIWVDLISMLPVKDPPDLRTVKAVVAHPWCQTHGRRHLWRITRPITDSSGQLIDFYSLPIILSSIPGAEDLMAELVQLWGIKGESVVRKILQIACGYGSIRMIDIGLGIAESRRVAINWCNMVYNTCMNLERESFIYVVALWAKHHTKREVLSSKTIATALFVDTCFGDEETVWRINYLLQSAYVVPEGLIFSTGDDDVEVLRRARVLLRQGKAESFARILLGCSDPLGKYMCLLALDPKTFGPLLSQLMTPEWWKPGADDKVQMYTLVNTAPSQFALFVRGMVTQPAFLKTAIKTQHATILRMLIALVNNVKIFGATAEIQTMLLGELADRSSRQK